MKIIHATPLMAQRMLAWLQEAGIIEFDDTLTIADLVLAARKTPTKETIQ